MKIKDDDEQESSWYKKYRAVLRGFIPLYSQGKFSLSLAINVVLIAGIIAAFALSSVAFTESGKKTVSVVLYAMNIEPMTVASAVSGIQSENIRIPGHVFRGWLAAPEHISIDIRNNDFQQLSWQRDAALSRGTLADTDAYVPATIRYHDEKIKAEVKLKGNSIEHWGTDSWSLKVKTEGDSRFRGMREFSLQKPWTRNYLTEWVFHRILSYENIPHVPFSFVEVQVNGKDMGIYALEESVEDRLFDATGHPPGPALHMNDEISRYLAAGYTFRPLKLFPVDSYNEGEYNSSQARRDQTRKASDLFEAFRFGTITTHEAFDIKTLATFVALSDLTGNYNGYFTTNIRPYYNPVTSKLELIGNDALTTPISKIFYVDNREFNQRISNDTDFVWLYVHELERVSDPGYLDRFFSETDADFEQNLSIIYKENPYYHFPREIYYQNQKIIRDTIFPYLCQYAYLENVTSDGVVYIESGAAQPMPVEVLGLRLNGRLVPQTGGPTILPGTNDDEVMTYQTLAFRLPEGVNQVTTTDNLTLDCRVYGTTPVKSEPVIGKKRLSDWPPGEDIVRRPHNTGQFSWLNKDEKNQTFTIQPGKWEVPHDLIIPEGYTVISPDGGGTRLDLTQGSMILSYSPLWLSGDENLPFEVTSSDGSGQGILLLNVDNESFFSYVRFSNLSVPDRNGWQLPSSVTFYRSPVIIDQSEFVEGRVPGSLLSIVRGDAKISGSRFMHSEGDLLNLAYSSLEVQDTHFLGPADSGITGTGSTIHVHDSTFYGPLGFGIRGMRASHITLGNSYFSDVQVAGTAEDGSKVTFYASSINSGAIGLAAYTNTPGYGPGTVIAENVQIVNTHTPFMVEKGSSVTTGSSRVPASESQVFPQIKEIAGISA